MAWNPFRRSKSNDITLPVETPKKLKRSFLGANFNRLTNDFLGGDSVLADMADRVNLRARARQLAKNDPYAAKFISLVRNNTLGPNGITLSAQIQNKDGSSDEKLNDLVETLWWKWSRNGNCDVTGKYSFKKLLDLIVEALSRDGEALVWLRRGQSFGDYKFQLQFLDAEYLDDTYQNTQNNGVIIRDGIEFNQFGKPIAYHIRKSIDDPLRNNSTDRIRVPAEDIVHIFNPQYANQHRGITPLAPVMLALHNLSKYRESELIAARIAACKQAYLTKIGGEDFQDDETDEFGNVPNAIETGVIDILPDGYDIKFSDFSSPSTTFDTFNKAQLRGIAAGLGVNYNSLDSNLESVNYSSARFGLLEEINTYKIIQNLLIDEFLTRVFEDWLRIQLLNGKIPFPVTYFDKINKPKWVTKGWRSVDPGKDASANKTYIELNLKTRTEILAETGQDFEEVMLQIAKEKQLMDKLGIQDKDLTKIEMEAELAAQNSPSEQP